VVKEDGRSNGGHRMILDDLRGEVAIIKLRSHEELATFGITTANIYAKVIEVDERVGIWVENPKWSPRTRGDEEESHLAHILIRWEYVIGIMTFPEREGIREEEDIKPIGFVRE
jgi:hypothetical protein